MDEGRVRFPARRVDRSTLCRRYSAVDSGLTGTKSKYVDPLLPVRDGRRFPGGVRFDAAVWLVQAYV